MRSQVHQKTTNKGKNMKTTTKTALALLALGASAWIITAQDSGNRPKTGSVRHVMRGPTARRPVKMDPGQDAVRRPRRSSPRLMPIKTA